MSQEQNKTQKNKEQDVNQLLKKMLYEVVYTTKRNLQHYRQQAKTRSRLQNMIRHIIQVMQKNYIQLMKQNFLQEESSQA